MKMQKGVITVQVLFADYLKEAMTLIFSQIHW